MDMQKGGPNMQQPGMHMQGGKGGPGQMGGYQGQPQGAPGQGGPQVPGAGKGAAGGKTGPDAEKLNASQLSAAPPALQKQMLGEQLYVAVAKQQPELAGKITGMMLEMENAELLTFLSDEQGLKMKIEEAMRVLVPQQAQNAPLN